DERRAKGVAARRVLAVAVCCESSRNIEARPAAGDDVEHAGRDDGADYLNDDVWQHTATRESTAGPDADRHGWIEMSAGNRSQRMAPRQHSKAEPQGATDEADAEIRKGRRKHGSAAAAEHEPEGSKKLAQECWIHMSSNASAGLEEGAAWIRPA